MTKVIKNPSRKANQFLGKREFYQPEYVKLGIDAPKPNVVPKEDFEYAFSKRKTLLSSSKKAEEPSKHEDRMRKYKGPMVNSGGNHEHTWHPVAQYFDEETIPLEQVDEEIYPWDKDKDYADLEQEEKKSFSEKINYNEVASTEDYDQDLTDEMNSESKQNKYLKYSEIKKSIKNLQSVPVEGYCISVHGNVVYISETLAEVEAMLEYVLFDQKSPLGDVSIEDISVFKKLSIRAGVVVRE